MVKFRTAFYKNTNLNRVEFYVKIRSNWDMFYQKIPAKIEVGIYS